MYVWSAHSGEYYEPGEVTIPDHGRITRKIMFSLSLFSPEKWVRGAVSAVLSWASPLILHTQAESSAYSRDSCRFPRRHPHIYSQPLLG